MNTNNEQDTTHLPPPQYGYPMPYQKEDEIDLYALFSAIFSQWKLLSAVTLGGTLLALLYALMIPKQYEVSIQIAQPASVNIKELNTRGYISYSQKQVYVNFFNRLRSAENLKKYFKTTGAYKKLFPNIDSDTSENVLFTSLYNNLETNYINPRQDKSSNQDPVPNLVSLTLKGSNEDVLVKLINNYVSYTNTYALEQIKQQGKHSASLEIEKVTRTISELRLNSKAKRELLIAKLEAKNFESIASLELEKKLLLEKAKKDKTSKIAQLKEAYAIAKKLGIKTITTIDALATESKSTKTMVSLGGKDSRLDALMGTVYLNSELEILQNRQDDSLFITALSVLAKKIEFIKHDKKLAALKERKTDDPYIEELPNLLKKLNQLKQISFDFSTVQLYQLDKSASIGNSPVKPKKTLIVVIGFVLSGFISLFVVLIVNSIKNHNLEDDLVT